MKKVELSDLGKFILETRLKRHMTQLALSDAIRLKPAAVSAYEIGRVFPSLRTLKKILKVLNVSGKIVTRLKTPRYYSQIWVGEDENSLTKT